MWPDDRCRRCEGMLVYEQDHQWEYWKCAMCGDRFDRVVVDHRYVQTQLEAIYATASDSCPGPSDCQLLVDPAE